MIAVSPTPEEAAATIAENVGHISRGCRSRRSHNPNVYEQAIEDALAVLVAALRDARRERDEWRDRAGRGHAATLDALVRAERERDQARDALAAIDEEARQAKIAVESVTIDQPVGVTENVAIYHFGIVRTRARAALGGAAE